MQTICAIRHFFILYFLLIVASQASGSSKSSKEKELRSILKSTQEHHGSTHNIRSVSFESKVSTKTYLLTPDEALYKFESNHYTIANIEDSEDDEEHEGPMIDPWEHYACLQDEPSKPLDIFLFTESSSSSSEDEQEAEELEITGKNIKLLEEQKEISKQSGADLNQVKHNQLAAT